MEQAQTLLQGEWPSSPEVELLRRAQAMHTTADAKLRKLTRDFRAHRLYPRRMEIRSLQLHVHHTFTPPVVASDDGATPGSPGRWTLYLQAMDIATGTPTPVNLVHYFRKVSFELEPRLYSDSVVEWTCFQKGNHEINTLQVARTGHTPHTVRVKLLPSHPLERYVLSEELRSALAPYFTNPLAQSYTKQDILMATWEYIKRKNLIKEHDCRVALCDPTLRSLFNCESLPFTSIVVALRPHLTAAPALDFEYHLSLSSDAAAVSMPAAASPDSSEFSTVDHEKPLDEKVVTVDVGHVDEVERARELALQEWEDLQQEQQKELDLLQRQETHLLTQLHAYQRKYEWMQQFAHDPAGFVADVVKSQQADEQILTAEAETDEINVPNAHQFSQPWVREVVAELLVAPPRN